MRGCGRRGREQAADRAEEAGEGAGKGEAAAAAGCGGRMPGRAAAVAARRDQSSSDTMLGKIDLLYYQGPKATICIVQVQANIQKAP